MSKDLPRPRLGHKLHDSFFRVVFGGHLSAAIGALRAVLPARLAAALDFERFEALSGEFVTAALRQRRVDLLFRVWLRGLEARLVWLFEQQAKPLRLMVWRASDYTAAIWRAEVLDHRKGPADNKSAIRPRSRTPGPAYRFGRSSTYRLVRLRRVLQGRSALTHDPTPSVARLIVCRALRPTGATPMICRR